MNKVMQDNAIARNDIDNMVIARDKDFLTATEVAALIGKHPKWLERKRWAGGGPAFRYIGRTPIYERQDVINWIASIPKVNNTSQTN